MGKTLAELQAASLANAITSQQTWGNVLIIANNYGAKAGAPDNTTAIQKAINAARDAGKTEVYFLPGHYNYTTLLNTDDMVFVGDGITFSGSPTVPIASYSQLAGFSAQLAEKAPQTEIARIESEIADTNDEISRVELELSHKATKFELETEKARIDTLVAHAGDTDGNAELLDLRVGFGGDVYSTAGEAVRKVGEGIGFPAKNIISNGDFSAGTTGIGQGSTGATFEVNSEEPFNGMPTGKITLTTPGAASRITIVADSTDHTVGDIMYVGARVRPTVSSRTRLSFAGLSLRVNTPANQWTYISGNLVSQSSFSTMGIHPDDTNQGNTVTYIWGVIALNLTKIFGAGNEPSAPLIDALLDQYQNGWFKGTTAPFIKNKMLYKKTGELENSLSQVEEELQDIKNSIGQTSKYSLKISTLPDLTGDTSVIKDLSPVLFGVKMSNARNKTTGHLTHPKPTGWLYYTWDSPNKILYASGRPDNMVELCKWNSGIAEGLSPMWYAPFVTKDGDIIFVYKGEILGGDQPNLRKNPIIYPAGDYDNPFVVDFGSSTKPTSWLQNCGADYLYHQDCLIFTEYVRPGHDYAYVWKVTKPFSNPSNWRIVKTFDVAGGEIEHTHTINYDPFSDKVLLTTGDSASESKIYMSSDYGETWDLQIENNARQARLLNFIFTKDKVYWASDDANHAFMSVPRLVDGTPDFENITEEYDFNGTPPTYVTCLINDPYGLLFLNRYDSSTSAPLEVFFYDLDTSTMHTLGNLYPVNGVAATYGFRCEATNWYQANGDNRIVCGFGHRVNGIDVLGNVVGDRADRINNLVLEVVRR